MSEFSYQLFKTQQEGTQWDVFYRFNSSGQIYNEINKKNNYLDETNEHYIDPYLQRLSQKVMKQIWDNKEDEFWDKY